MVTTLEDFADYLRTCRLFCFRNRVVVMHHWHTVNREGRKRRTVSMIRLEMLDGF